MHEEEARLLDALTECQRLSLAALSALKHPVRSVLYKSEEYEKLVGADAAARVNYDAARVALQVWRTAEKKRAIGA
jgi:hypothetical protein